MNDEIKEIKINKANKSVTFINNGIAFSQFGIADEILDLITNLQQKCEYLERSNNRREDTIIGLRFEVAEQEDYKSRCEKASVILNNIYMLDNVTITNNACEEIDKAINILQGENNDN